MPIKDCPLGGFPFHIIQHDIGNVLVDFLPNSMRFDIYHYCIMSYNFFFLIHDYL